MIPKEMAFGKSFAGFFNSPEIFPTCIQPSYANIVASKPAPKAEKNERFSPAWIGNSWKSTPSCLNKPKITITNKGMSLQTSVID